MKKSKPIVMLIVLAALVACAAEVQITPVHPVPSEPLYEEQSAGRAIIDTLHTQCDCFSKESLEDLVNLSWSSGWWSDVPGCKPSPYSDLVELWIPYAKVNGSQFNISLQAGYIHGRPFASSSVYNHKTGVYDMICGGYIAQEKAAACTRLLVQHIKRLAVSHPALDYCNMYPE